MRRTVQVLIAALVMVTLTVPVVASDVTLKLSGPGSVNDSTIKAGEPFFIDVYWTTDTTRFGFTAGFKISSKDIKKVIHVTDSAGGLNDNGDIKGHNGWEDRTVFDMTGVMCPTIDWDGKLPDVMGFGGAVAKKRWEAHKSIKTLSMELIVPTAGVLTVDTSFWPPAGYWKYGSGAKATWDGPYHFKVIK